MASACTTPWSTRLGGSVQALGCVCKTSPPGPRVDDRVATKIGVSAPEGPTENFATGGGSAIRQPQRPPARNARSGSSPMRVGLLPRPLTRGRSGRRARLRPGRSRRSRQLGPGCRDCRNSSRNQARGGAGCGSPPPESEQLQRFVLRRADLAHEDAPDRGRRPASGCRGRPRSESVARPLSTADGSPTDAPRHNPAAQTSERAATGAT